MAKRIISSRLPALYFNMREENFPNFLKKLKINQSSLPCKEACLIWKRVKEGTKEILERNA